MFLITKSNKAIIHKSSNQTFQLNRYLHRLLSLNSERKATSRSWCVCTSLSSMCTADQEQYYSLRHDKSDGSTGGDPDRINTPTQCTNINKAVDQINSFITTYRYSVYEIETHVIWPTRYTWLLLLLVRQCHTLNWYDCSGD